MLHRWWQIYHWKVHVLYLENYPAKLCFAKKLGKPNVLPRWWRFIQWIASPFKQLGSTAVVPSSGIVKPNFDIVIISKDEKSTATPFYKLFLNHCFLVIFLLLLCLWNQDTACYLKVADRDPETVFYLFFWGQIKLFLFPLIFTVPEGFIFYRPRL